MAAATVSLAADAPPFRYNTNNFRPVKLPDGSWAITPKNKAAAPAPAVKATTTEKSARWIDSITVAPVGALKTADLDGPSQWGAGFLIGANVNPFVAIQVRALSFEGEGKSTSERKTDKGFGPVTTGEDDWGGRLIDEISILVPARISRFSSESFSLLVIPSGNYDLNNDDYGIGVGLGAELAFNKTFSLSVDYSVRAWFHKPTHVDSLVTGQVNLKF